MKITSAEAAKILRGYTDEYNNLCIAEQNGKEYNAAVGEDPDELRPEYDYASTQAQLEELDRKIRTLKHTINIFNSSTEVPGFDMTIDQVLVYIPQLTARINRLFRMMNVLPKRRCTTSNYNNIIDYTYTNYDPAQAKADYEKARNTLAKLQTALDLVNSTVTMEFEP